MKEGKEKDKIIKRNICELNVKQIWRRIIFKHMMQLNQESSYINIKKEIKAMMTNYKTLM
ncbi:MAG: hypothetical protein ACLR43_13985 [Faecalibacillus faecis]